MIVGIRRLRSGGGRVEAFISRPTEILKAYMPPGHRWDSFELGRFAMGLEVLTVIKTLEGSVGNSLLALEREEIVSVLRTLLRSQGLEDGVNEWYERLGEWRRVKWVRQDAVTGEYADDRESGSRSADASDV